MGIYLDHAATTFIEERVLKQMLPYFTDTYGNASSLHTFGRDAHKGVLKARKQTAAAIGAKTGEVYFTSGGTESDNWAIKGAAQQKGSGHIITSAIEHHAVLDSCKHLETQGFDVTYLPVDQDGLVSASGVADAIRDDTILISIMFANNETGAIMPIQQIGQIAKQAGVLFHTDAVQAVGHVQIDVDAQNIDLLSLSAHKFYGPKGVGALYVRKGVKIDKFIHGGAQEKGRRAGTTNTPAIVGLGAAIEISQQEMDAQNAREERMAQRLKEGLLSVPDTRLNGHEIKRLPGNVNVSFDGLEAEALMLHLDLMGIATSTGSACSSGSTSPSYVLQQMGLTTQAARAAIRFTVGRANTMAQMDTVIEKTQEIVAELREMSPLYATK